MRRRRFLIGFGTIVLGGSGFVASGAVDVGSIGSSGGQGWVALATPDIEDPDEIDGGGSQDDGADDDGGDDHDPRGEIRVQIVKDPDGGGANRTGRLSNRPRVVASEHVRGDEEGFLDGFDLGAMNVDAETWVGRTAGAEPPNEQEVAFIIANVGGVGRPDRDGQAVDLTLYTFADEAAAEPIETDALRFPWAVDATRGGDNLVGTTVRLAPRRTIGVSIVVDGSDRAAEQVRSMGIAVDRIQGQGESDA